MQRFLIVVNFVRRHPVEELVAKLSAGKTITKDQVVRESRLPPPGNEHCLH